MGYTFVVWSRLPLPWQCVIHLVVSILLRLDRPTWGGLRQGSRLFGNQTKPNPRWSLLVLNVGASFGASEGLRRVYLVQGSVV